MLTRSREVVAVALRAIIFDCDGVLVDSEPLHYASFKKALGERGAQLTEEVYKDQYLALDDRGAFRKFYNRLDLPLESADLKNLMDAKGEIFNQLVQSEGLLPFPAVPEFVMAAAQRYPLAIASGARRHEVEMVLETSGIRPYFEVVVTSDDVQKGKPDPESFLKALEGLNSSGKRSTPIRPDECVVIEDSKDGIISAHAAGMRCAAVTTSYPSFELSGADLVVPTLASMRLSQLEDLFVSKIPLPQPTPHPQSH